MKANTHPNWSHTVTVSCACGATFQTGSTSDAIQVDICSKCHPFFTGEMKFVDTQGRVEKFKLRQQTASVVNASKKAKKKEKQDKQQQPVLSLKDMLQSEKETLSQAA